jgi:hypothetical protein
VPRGPIDRYRLVWALFAGARVSGRDQRVNRCRSVIAVATVVLALVVGACSGEPEPKFAPPSQSSSPQMEATPSESPQSQLPLVARRHTRAGAEAFVRFWFETFSLAMTSGNTQTVDDLSAQRCVSCSALSTTIDDLYRKGGHVKTAGWLVEASFKAPDYEASQPRFVLRVRQAKRTLYGRDGEVVDRTSATKVPMRVTLDRRGSGWKVGALEILG